MQENTQPTDNTQPENKKTNMIMLIAIVVVVSIAVIAAAAYFLFINKSQGSTMMDEESMESASEEMMEKKGREQDSIMMEESTPSSDSIKKEEVMGMESEVKTFQINGGNFYFEPKNIEVNTGDTVKIAFSNIEGTHDWRLDEFDAKSEITQTGQTTEITFVADKAGEYEFYCSIGSHREMGMVGTLIVK